jgi:hypothetical protein
MKRFLFSIVTLVACVTLVAIPAYAYSSNICKGSKCTLGEVGAFMAGITGACGNTGDCTLDDILTVFVNVGNYIVGIIGAIVLVMYIIGGFYLLVSGGNSGRVKKGWSFLKTSTIGLAIVMFSYLGIYALRGVLQYGAVAITDKGYVVCTGASTTGQPCGLNETCMEDGTCKSLCEQEHPDIISYQDDYDGIFTKIQYYACVDKVTAPTSDDGTSDRWYTPSTCIPNKCWGDENVQCCQVDYFY